MKESFSVGISITYDLEILRETNPTELELFNEEIDGDYGGWYWMATVHSPWGTSVDLECHGYCETEGDAYESAEDTIREYLEDHICIY